MNESEPINRGGGFKSAILAWLIFFTVWVVIMAVADVWARGIEKQVYLAQFVIALLGASVCLGLLRLGRWLCNARNWGRFAIGLGILATLVAGFYLEEDWRGKHAWEVFNADAKAKGIVLDWAKYQPPVIPDDQNFFTASTNIGIRFKKAQTDAEIAAAEKCQWLPTYGGTNSYPVFQNWKTNPVVVAIITVGSAAAASVDQGHYDLTLNFNGPDTAQKVQGLIAQTVGKIANGSTGIELSERSISNLAPVHILLGSDTLLTAGDLRNLEPANLTINLEKLQIQAGSVAGQFEATLTDVRVASAADYLKWSDQYVAALDEIREALKRPAAILPGDYSEPYNIPIPNFVTMRFLAQTLAQRAQCYLMLNQPDQAWRELALMHDVCGILHRPPAGKPITLVESMINAAISSVYVPVIQDGFRWHAWQEPQLFAMQEQIEHYDVLALVRNSLDGEQVFTVTTLIDTPLARFRKLMWPEKKGPFWQYWSDPVYVFYCYGPRGWVYQNAIHHVGTMQQFLPAYDVTNQLIQPKVVARWTKGQTHRLDWAPYSFWESIASPNMTKASQTVAFDQTLLNEADIACALERYHFKNGRYPETLEALVPQFIGKLPHDIIGGEPLHYRRTEDGKFLLYSIGWNETDDGGKAGVVRSGVGYADGDWVWKGN